MASPEFGFCPAPSVGDMQPVFLPADERQPLILHSAASMESESQV